PSRLHSPTGSGRPTALHCPPRSNTSQTCTALSRRWVRCRCLCRARYRTMDLARHRRRGTCPPTTPGDDPMRIHRHNPDLLTTALHATLAREAALLTHRLRGALQDPPLIDVTLTHRPDREDYTVHLLLRLEDRDLTATGEGSTPGVAIRDAFDALADAITP